MNKLLLIFILLFSQILKDFGQQGPLYSQYMVNKFLINPAVAGLNGYTSINTVFREQYFGFANAPRTYAITAQTRLLENTFITRMLQLKKKRIKTKRDTKVGLGANLFSDRNGIVSKTGLELSYAYHFNINNDFQVSMGLAGSGYQYKLDDSNAYLNNPDDPLLKESRKAFLVPDATMGIYVTNNRLYTGFSMTDLFGSSIKLGKSHFKDNFRTVRNFCFMSGYRQYFDNGFAVEPSIMIRATKLVTQFDFSSKIYYKKNYWAGVSYRTNKTLVTMVGMFVNMFYFAYAFDTSFGAIKNYNTGSHEIMLGVRFGDTNTKRYRWIKKDQIEFEL